DDGFFEDLCAGDNIVIVEDATGCTDTATVQIAAPDSLNADAFQILPVSCFGGNDGQAMVDVVGGVEPYEYLWSDPLGQILSTATLLQAGPLSVQITDANNCTITVDTEIDEPPVLTMATDFTDALCFGDETGSAVAMPTGGVYPYTYAWTDPNNTIDSTATGLGAGNYTVQVMDDNGCTISETVIIGEPLSPVEVIIDQTVVSCFNQNQGEAIAMASGGTGPNYTYSWSNGDVTATADGLSAAAYSVTATDVNGCEAIADVDINQYEPLEILVIFSPVSCDGGNDGALAVTNIDGGSGGVNVTYQWSADPTLNADVIEGLAGGQSYTVTVTDDGGCSAVEEIFLPEPAPIEVQTSVTDVLCFGGETGTATVTDLINGQAPYTYDWGVNANNQITQTATDLAAGNYTVQIIDDLGCAVLANVEILQPTPIDISFSVISNECFGDTQGSIGTSVDGGVGNYSYNWSNSDVGAAIDGLPAGQYVVTVTDGNGCEQLDSTDVLQPDPIDPILFPDNVTCFGDRDGAITVEPSGGTPPFLYSLDGQIYTGSSTLIGLTAGEYGVFIQDGNGCVWYEETFVSQPLDLEVISAVGDEVTIDLGQTVELDIDVINNLGDFTVEWIAPYEGTLSCTNCPNPISNTQNTITYEVFVQDDQGCDAITEVTVRVIKERVVLVPTAFSPNGDTNNDLLLVHGKEGTVVELFQIFDRWGELVYEDRNFLVNDPQRGWNGVFRGQLMNSGVFIWYVEALYIDGDRETFKGSTTLIR
ncbi:MAG: gliding motility-associated C-terminal domain-containing protein, partial [Bacteroidota bacterium]